MSVKTIEGGMTVSNARFCVVVARWNSFVVDSLEAGAIDTLKRHGAREEDITVVRLPGAFEMPLVLDKVAAKGEYDAIVLAEAGIQRLELTELTRTVLPLEIMLPAPGQGALGIEIRSDDTDAFEAVTKLDVQGAHAAVVAERTVLSRLHGGCLAPIAAFAEVNKDALNLNATVLSADGKKRLDQQSSIHLTGNWNDCATEIATTVSNALLEQGAAELISAAR